MVAEASPLTDVDSISANDIWAVGRFSTASTNEVLIEHWNGTRWRVTTHPFTASDSLEDVARIPGTTRAWTVGSASDSTLTGRSTGTTWAAVPSPNVDAFPNGLEGVSATSSTDAWAVGSYHDGVDHSLVERWNGTDWSVVPSPDVGTEGTALVAVGASSSTRAQAVGQRVKGPLDRIIAERWNGSEWKVIAFPNVGVGSNFVADLATIPGTNSAWAVGFYSDLDSARPLAERYC
jgi:hypothetical protein